MPKVLKHRYLRASYLSYNFFKAISEAPCGEYNNSGCKCREALHSATERAAEPAISRKCSGSRCASGRNVFLTVRPCVLPDDGPSNASSATTSRNQRRVRTHSVR